MLCLVYNREIYTDVFKNTLEKFSHMKLYLKFFWFIYSEFRIIGINFISVLHKLLEIVFLGFTLSKNSIVVISAPDGNMLLMVRCYLNNISHTIFLDAGSFNSIVHTTLHNLLNDCQTTPTKKKGVQCRVAKDKLPGRQFSPQLEAFGANCLSPL